MSNNRIILEGCISTFKRDNELDLPDSGVFEIFSLTQIHKDIDITPENISSSIVDGGNDGGIDSIMVFIDDEFMGNIDELDNINFSKKTKSKFIIAQCKKENSFKESTIDKLVANMPTLLDLNKQETELLNQFNSNVVSQTILLRETWKETIAKGGSISLHYIYATNATSIEINSVFNRKIEQLIDTTKRCLSTNNIFSALYSSNELLQFYQKQKNNRLTLDFKDRPLLTEYRGAGTGYIGIVKLAHYKKFLTSETGSIRDDLFESNIRHFQGLVDVNKKIKHSVEEINNEDFWWLNNGITIIAEEPKEAGKTLSIENIQIVNGLQTSYSIFNHHNGDPNDERSVLVKVVINKDKEIVDNIIASTNSQNPVSPTLLRATEPIQREIELFFLNEGYFYDRRKNYYKNQGKPSTRIFSIQWTAQAIEALVFNNPHTARSQPTSLLKNESNYNRIFDRNKMFKGFLNCCIIISKVHLFWLHHSDSALKSKAANFKLHTGCIMLRFCYNRNTISYEDITNISIEYITERIFNQALSFLNANIDSFLLANPHSNLINIAKSKDFSEYLFDKLQEHFH